MGLVFVLLLGEIDLSAGFAGGVCAAVMVRLMVGYDHAVAGHHRRGPASPAWSSDC